MELKIKILEKGPMILTGSKVLKAIMDDYTPPVDLFTREVIQNSGDAILDDREYGKIRFDIGTFKNDLLLDCIESIRDNVKRNYPNDEYSYISISDSNTCGLLGTAEKSNDEKNNNLYNLVYDFMNDKDGDTAGGSCGIGKSIYYRYGNGICFYYSRTHEDNKYISKLAGALIQNEKKQDCFIGENSSGIAYFGNIENNKSTPIIDEDDIRDFLTVFNIKPYENDETGTVVIIPYFDCDSFVERNNNSDDDTPRYWLDSIESCLSMSIQRWYFPRINNEFYNGKYLKVAINGHKIELCDFFLNLQSLYNGDLPGCQKLSVEGKGFVNGEILGSFNYKLFDKNELGIHVPPINNPEPKYFVDSNNDCDRDGLLFYTRKPGMILNYDNKEFGSYEIEEDKYLIGVFILNDDLNIEGENLGKYIRKTEKSNHIEWTNDNFKDFPVLSKRKPFKKISSAIKNHLNDIFKHTKVVQLDGTATILQRKFGEKLLPPSDFGDKPSPPIDGGGGSSTPKKRRLSIVFNGVDEDGVLSYTVDFTLKKNEKMVFNVNIKAGTKTYTFSDWEGLEFDYPCKIMRFEISEFYVGGSKKSYPQIVPFNYDFTKRKRKTVNGIDMYKVKGIASTNGTPCGLIIYNAQKEQLRVKLDLQIKPLDNKYSIGFSSIIKEEVPNE